MTAAVLQVTVRLLVCESFASVACMMDISENIGKCRVWRCNSLLT